MPAAEPRRRLPPDERRELILESATRLFTRLPYSQVSTTEIARGAGITRGLLNHYFNDKRGLYREVVRRAVLLPTFEVTPDLLPEMLAMSTGERIDAAVAWFLDAAELHADTYFSVADAEGSADDIAPIIREAEDEAARRVMVLVGIDEPDETAMAMVRAYGGMVEAAITEWLRRKTLTREQAHAMLRDVLLFITSNVLTASSDAIRS